MATKCDHEWDVFQDVPGGEDPTRYRKCKLCGVIGLTYRAAYLVSSAYQKGVLRVKLVRCTVSKCSKFAVTRNWGRINKGTRIRWVCEDHIKERP